MFEIERRANYFGSLRAKLVLAPLGMPKCQFHDPQCSSLKPPPSMHRKLTEHARCHMQNNQLLTKSHVELEDNSDECYESILFDLFRV